MPMEISYLGRLFDFIDSKTGIIRDAVIFRNHALDPKVFCAIANPASLLPHLGYDFDNRGAACGLTRSRALIRAVGECIERYSSAFYNERDLVFDTSENLSANRIEHYSHSLFYPFSEQQYNSREFRFKRIESGTEIHWVSATDFSLSTKVFVPASCVFLPYRFEKEPISHDPISTGLAAGISIDDCIEKGVAEIVERDALMIAWKSSLTPTRINIDGIETHHPEIAKLLNAVCHLPGRWYVNLLTRDINVPVVSAAFIDSEGLPLTSFGISAHKDFACAMASAIEEALLSRFLLNRTTIVKLPADSPLPDLSTLRGHLFSHAVSPNLKEEFLSIFDTGPVSTFFEIFECFKSGGSVLEETLKSGFKVLYRDVTTADLKASGVYSVRVLIPGMEPLDNDHYAPFLGGCRLAAALIDLTGDGSIVRNINGAPHPFP